MKIETKHDEKFMSINEGHLALVKSLIEYMHQRKEDAEIGEITIQHNHKMICIAPYSNRGPFWAVEGLKAMFNLSTGCNFNHNLRIYTIGYCLKIHSGTKILRMLITDSNHGNSQREILIPIEHIGRYFLVDETNQYFTPPLELRMIEEDEE